jgi:uncharacterized protein DUF6491
VPAAAGGERATKVAPFDASRGACGMDAQCTAFNHASKAYVHVRCAIFSQPSGGFMNNNILMAIAGLAFVSSLSAAPSDPLPNANKNACFSLTFVKDRRVLDPQHLIVWANNSSPYLVTLDRPMQDLEYSGNSIALIDGDRDGYICRTIQDGILIQDTIMPKRSQVMGVTRLTPDDLKLLETKYNTSLERKKRGQHGSDAKS